ncbi:MAG: glycosyltransferase family 9 protein [Caulobacteraceae bacterium]
MDGGDLPLAKLAALEGLPVDFLSLQKGRARRGRVRGAGSERLGGPPIAHAARDIHDFADTAALMEALDLVITVDTAAAHLAGALGRPVWIVNRYDACWRWLTERSDSPWYPSARLFRQPSPGDWDSVLAEVRRELQVRFG